MDTTNEKYQTKNRWQIWKPHMIFCSNLLKPHIYWHYLFISNLFIREWFFSHHIFIVSPQHSIKTTSQQIKSKKRKKKEKKNDQIIKAVDRCLQTSRWDWWNTKKGELKLKSLLLDVSFRRWMTWSCKGSLAVSGVFFWWFELGFHSALVTKYMCSYSSKLNRA